MTEIGTSLKFKLNSIFPRMMYLVLLVQYDVYGDLLGLLAAHPVTPLVSIHHLDVVDPIFPGMSQVKSLQRLFESIKLDSSSIMQQSICYDKKRSWSISISWGYVVQILRGIVSPRELEMPTRTFLNWYRKADYTAYAFNTRPVSKHPCQKPFIFYMSTTRLDRARRQTVGVYSRHRGRHPACRWKMDSPEKIDSITVLKRPDDLRWQRVWCWESIYVSFLCIMMCKIVFSYWPFSFPLSIFVTQHYSIHRCKHLMSLATSLSLCNG